MKLMNHHFSFTQLLHVDTCKPGSSQNVAENVKRLCRLSLEGLLTARVIQYPLTLLSTAEPGKVQTVLSLSSSSC